MNTRAKRVFLALALFMAVVLVAALVGAYMISRDVSFDWENPNVVEANRFRSKLKRYDTAVTNASKGFVRFSQVEINSYISRTLTNNADANGNGMHLRRLAVGLGETNLTLFSWGEYRMLNMPLKFVVQREFRIEQDGTNQWEMPLASFKVGEIEVPENWWPRVSALIDPLDQPVRERYAWTTNIQALLVRKNEVSSKPELRLYTYKPIPAEDRR